MVFEVEDWEKVSAIYAAGDTTVGIQENGTLLAQGSGAGLIRREITLRNVKAGDLWPFSLATTSAAWIDSKGNFCVMELQGGTPKVLATHLGPRYRPAAGPVPRAYLSNGRLYPNLDLGSSLPLRPLPSSRIRYAWLNWDTCFILTDDGRVHYGLAASRKDKRTKPETGILDARNTLRTSGKIMGFIVLDGGRRLMLVVDRSGKLVRYMYDTGTSQVDRL